MRATLVVLAAGMGSRYGSDKQIDGVGPHGEMLMQYAIYDALRAGFDKVVFIVKREHQALIERMCGENLRKHVQVEFVYQEYASLPGFYQVPAERVKPFGTVHALLCAKDAVQEPFAVINADDYYGPSAYRTIYDAITTLPETGRAAMVGYRLKNTVSPNGAVTRGLCSVQNGDLSTITETYQIRLNADGSIVDTFTDPVGVPLDGDAVVSMNLFGFRPWIFAEAQARFETFLRTLGEGELKAEYVLPTLVDECLQANLLKMQVLPCEEKWFGMTYQQDRATVAQTLRDLHAQGVYPEQLFT